jgi:hypothetical protein
MRAISAANGCTHSQPFKNSHLLFDFFWRKGWSNNRWHQLLDEGGAKFVEEDADALLLAS